MSFMYRLSQGLTHLRTTQKAVTIPQDLQAFLRPGIEKVWTQLGAADQKHLIRVAQRLQKQGASDDLVAAGLLHDLGKVRPNRIIGAFPRTIHVLIRQAPKLHEITARVVHDVRVLQAHARIGAELCRNHGYSERVCWLIAHHEDQGNTDSDLKLLQHIDSQS